MANGTINVRSSAAGSAIGQQTSGALGTTTNGPVTASLSGTSYTWWYVNFDSGVDGWVASIGVDRVASTTVDVQPRNVTRGSSSVTAGGSLSVSWQIRNNGTGTAASSNSQVRITTSNAANGYGNSSNNVGSSVSTGTIAAGATINQSRTVTVPATPGTYYVWVVADNNGALTQTNTSNDFAVSSSFTVTAATTVDVQPRNVTRGSSSVTAGGSLSVSWQIRNNGTGTAASSNSQVRITTSNASNGYGNSSNNVGSSVSTGTIAAGATINQSRTVTVPATPGTYYVWVVADNNGALAQTNTSNDFAVSSSFTVTAATTVDVQPINVTRGSSSVMAGGSLSVSWQIRNNGTGTAASSSSQVRISTSNATGGSGGPSTNVGSAQATGTITGGTTKNQSTTVTVPTTPGTYYVWVVADNNGALTQTNTSNDFAVSSSFTVTALVNTTYAITPSNPSVSEGAGSLTFTVTRSGGLPAETIYASTVQGSANGYASNSNDYTGLSNQAVTFTSNQTQRTVTVTITNDSVVEGNEVFGFIIQRTAGTAVTPFLAKTDFTIIDDDTQATTYTITPSNPSVSEGAGSLTFTVTRSGGLPAETIYASTVQGSANGYASNNNDYTGLSNQAVNFTSNQTQRTVTVTITNDSVMESNEIFGFIIQRTAGTAVTPFLAKTDFTIIDNDSSGLLPAPVITIPGSGSGPGSTVANLTPTFTWNSVTGANRYSLVISKHPYGNTNAVYQNHYLFGTSFTIPSGFLTSGTLYRWQLGAINSAGQEGAPSDILYFQTPATSQAPAAPSNLVAILNSQGVAVLTWSDNSNNETGFRIERRIGSASWGEIATTATSVAAAYDFATTAGNTYRYRVSAFNAAGTSAPSQEVIMDYPATGALSLLITAPAASTSWTAGESRQITWIKSGNTQSIGFIGVYYSLNGGGGYSHLPPNQSAASNSVTWQIPSNFSSNTARIKITAFSPSGVQLANHETANFTILSSASKPTARPDVSNLGPVQGSAVSFTGAASTAPAGRTISSYQWNLGDGTNRSGVGFSHSYANVGTYTATLTVTDSAGQSHSSSLSIRASGKSLGAENPSSYFADPVNLATGNFILEATDIEISGMGFPLKFSRFYNSKDTVTDGLPIGHGWTHSYHLQLTEGTGGLVTIRHGDGRRETHAPDGSGGYTAEAGVRDRLQKISASRFVLTSKDQMTYTFDGGLLTSISDRNNNTQILTYQSGRLSKITDSSGRFLEFTYNAQGRLVEVRDPIDRTIGYGYSADGDLLIVTDARGGETKYTYDGLHQILTAEDPNGNVFVTNQYDDQQRVVSAQRDAFGNLSEFHYDFVTGLTTVTDPFQNTTKHLHDDKLRLIAMTNELGETEHYDYDDDNNRTAVISRNGKTTRYLYDSRGNVTAKIDPMQRRTIIQYNSRSDPVHRMDAIGFARSMSGEQGGGYGVDFEYDTRGNLLRSADAKRKVTVMAYNAAGKLLSIKDRRDNTTRHEYDAAGNRVKSIDALNHESRATFDAVGRMLTSRNARNHTTHFDYDDADNLLSVRNPLDETIAHEYDPNGNRTLTRDAKGAETLFEYDAKDRLVKITDSEDGIVRHEYDAYDRKTKTIDARGKETRFEYDPAGRLSAVIDPLGNRTRYGYDPNGNRITVTDPRGKITRSNYDPLDRLVSVIDPLGNAISFEYDELGRRTLQRDALMRETRSEFDELGMLVKVTDPAGGIVRYDYDDNGNRIRMTNPLGRVTNSIYDELNRLVRREEPAGSTERYEYDEVGNRTKRTDAKGQVVTYQYDAADRLDRIIYPSGAPVIFGYDPNGKPLTMQDGLGTTSYEYDDLGRMTRYQSPYGHVVRYEYDANSNRSAMIYPGNKRVEYLYDNANRMTSVKDWQNRVTSYLYDTASRLVTTLNPNGTTTTQSYDDAGRLATLSNRGPGNVVINEYAYTLDAVGNHTQVQQNEPIDPTPNLGAFSYEYDEEDRIEEMEGSAQTHDANGNLTGSGPDLTLGYDFENRLISQQSTDRNWIWKYDGAGRRLEFDESRYSIRFVLDVNGTLPQVIMDAAEGEQVFMYYIYGLGLVSQIDSTGNANYYHYDSRGSTIAMTDAAGQPQQNFAYDPFGRLIGREPANASDRFMFLGRHGVVNDYNGFHYIRARHYSVRRGRFLQKDPFLGFDDQSQSLHRYMYALDNPINRIDINGFNAVTFSWNTYTGGSAGVGASASIGTTHALDLKVLSVAIKNIPSLIGMRVNISDEDYMYSRNNLVHNYATTSGSFRVGAEGGMGVAVGLGLTSRSAHDLGGPSLETGISGGFLGRAEINSSPDSISLGLGLGLGGGFSGGVGASYSIPLGNSGVLLDTVGSVTANIGRLAEEAAPIRIRGKK